MTVLTRASQQWATRPDDERFVSLPDLYAKVSGQRERSRAKRLPLTSMQFVADPFDDKGLMVEGQNGLPARPTHWSFGQVSARYRAPVAYLRGLVAKPGGRDMACHILNYEREVSDNTSEAGVLLTLDEDRQGVELRAATGPDYGRVWNADIVRMLIDRFGDGVTGQWRVPGEFGVPVEITKANTTFFGSDRDIFVFMADETRLIEMKNRREGLKSGSALCRGFFVWNSEVGDKSLGAAFFIYDYTCCNRMVWGVKEFKEIRLRHTSGAPERWLDTITPVLKSYSEASVGPIEATIQAAQAKQLGKERDVQKFLAERFGAAQARLYQDAHTAEEGRPIETLWDATVGMTAYAKTIKHTDARVQVERDAGRLLDLVAAK